MKLITQTESKWAEVLLKEIISDQSSWWNPVTKKHQIFEQAYMKFVNGNLNYYSFENMLLSLLEGYRYNKSLLKTLEFCEYVRTITNDRGPFGRMCVWKIPPDAELLPHRDNFKYHNMIIRNIFIVSKHNNSNSTINIQGEIVNYDQGTLFQFFPDKEEHSFKNNSNEPWYFLGFDFWIPELLFSSFKDSNLETVFDSEIRRQPLSQFGIGNCKYMSKH